MVMAVRWLDLEDVSLISGWAPIAACSLLALGLAALALLSWGENHARAGALLTAPSAGVLGTMAGGFAVWILSDVLRVFGVRMDRMALVTVAGGIGIMSLLAVVTVSGRGAARVVSAVLVPLTVVSAAMCVDVVYGEYPTLGSLLGTDPYPRLKSSEMRRATLGIKEWTRMSRLGTLPSMPSSGEVRSVSIPAGISGFAARDAVVYLPPAALSAEPPDLPVMVMLSGQPGSPTRFFAASRIAAIMDSFARRHEGLAPIVVSPDQNGSALHNSLCADTQAYGAAQTYLTRDVIAWIRANLPVSGSARDWLIGGFSQGATCSMQLGPAYPRIFGSILAVSSELEPAEGSRDVIIRFFHGSTALYDRHVPLRIIAAASPSTQSLFISAGSQDVDALHDQSILAGAARKAGMRVTVDVIEGSGHDWHTVRAALGPGIAAFCRLTGLSEGIAAEAAHPPHSDPRPGGSAHATIMTEDAS